MSARLFLKCDLCGCEVSLPADQGFIAHGIIAMPLHRRHPSYEPVETLSDPECCPASEQLQYIQHINNQRKKAYEQNTVRP